MKRIIPSLLGATLGALLTAAAWAGPSACSVHYAGGDAPEFTNRSMATKAREVCFSSFGVMHSGVTRTPLWSAEHLTRASLGDAKELTRVNAFHEEERLPANERAELSDYRRSGMDRGHMSPSADQPNARAQEESFSLANMVPQNSTNNQHIWNLTPSIYG